MILYHLTSWKMRAFFLEHCKNSNISKNSFYDQIYRYLEEWIFSLYQQVTTSVVTCFTIFFQHFIEHDGRLEFLEFLSFNIPWRGSKAFLLASLTDLALSRNNEILYYSCHFTHIKANTYHFNWIRKRSEATFDDTLISKLTV